MPATYKESGYLETGMQVVDGLATALAGFVLGLFGLEIKD
jgi:hypothetical protein